MTTLGKGRCPQCGYVANFGDEYVWLGADSPAGSLRCGNCGWFVHLSLIPEWDGVPPVPNEPPVQDPIELHILTATPLTLERLQEVQDIARSLGAKGTEVVNTENKDIVRLPISLEHMRQALQIESLKPRPRKAA